MKKPASIKNRAFENEEGDTFNLIECPECRLPDAHQQYFTVLDCGTCNNHQRVGCLKCGCVVNTRDY